MGNVYIAISPSNKKYIGATSQNTKERWKEHCQRAREGRPGAIYNAIRKYGAESFIVLSLFDSDNWEEIISKEVELIAENNTLYPNGYNLTIGGEGTPGTTITEEARQRMSAGQKKRYENPEQRKLLMEYGVKARQKISNKFAAIRAIKKEKQEKYLKSDEFKKLHSDRTKEGMLAVKDKVIECAKKRAADPMWRKKISAAKMGQGLGSKRTDETKAKQAAARKEWWAKRKNKTKTI